MMKKIFYFGFLFVISCNSAAKNNNNAYGEYKLKIKWVFNDKTLSKSSSKIIGLFYGGKNDVINSSIIYVTGINKKQGDVCFIINSSDGYLSATGLINKKNLYEKMKIYLDFDPAGELLGKSKGELLIKVVQGVGKNSCLGDNVNLLRSMFEFDNPNRYNIIINSVGMSDAVISDPEKKEKWICDYTEEYKKYNFICHAENVMCRNKKVLHLQTSSGDTTDGITDVIVFGDCNEK